MSTYVVRMHIRDIIESEDKGAPLSDADLTAILNEEGIAIKRRTVAKYRESMDIACQSQRRMRKAI